MWQQLFLGRLYKGTKSLDEEIYNNSYSSLTAPIEKTSYLNLGSKRIARDGTGGKSYYFTDHLGSTRIVMDSAGNCTYNEYAPFGEDFLTANAERYKFTGKEDDGATGLYYYNARYYDPAVGRFISEDVAKDGMNWWVYCRNNPLRYVDKDGLKIKLTDEFQSNEKIMQAYKEWADNSDKYNIMDQDPDNVFMFILYEGDREMAEACRYGNTRQIRVNSKRLDEYTAAHYATTLEHESTHALQPTAERKLDYEVLAHSEEYKFAERVYGDENPWKGGYNSDTRYSY